MAVKWEDLQRLFQSLIGNELITIHVQKEPLAKYAFSNQHN